MNRRAFLKLVVVLIAVLLYRPVSAQFQYNVFLPLIYKFDAKEEICSEEDGSKYLFEFPVEFV